MPLSMPQVAYGNILAEDPASLAPRHLRQLVLLGQACLDYLWAICMETSRIIVSSMSAAARPGYQPVSLVASRGPCTASRV